MVIAIKTDPFSRVEILRALMMQALKEKARNSEDVMGMGDGHSHSNPVLPHKIIVRKSPDTRKMLINLTVSVSAIPLFLNFHTCKIFKVFTLDSATKKANPRVSRRAWAGRLNKRLLSKR